MSLGTGIMLQSWESLQLYISDCCLLEAYKRFPNFLKLPRDLSVMLPFLPVPPEFPCASDDSMQTFQQFVRHSIFSRAGVLNQGGIPHHGNLRGRIRATDQQTQTVRILIFVLVLSPQYYVHIIWNSTFEANYLGKGGGAF